MTQTMTQIAEPKTAQEMVNFLIGEEFDSANSAMARRELCDARQRLQVALSRKPVDDGSVARQWAIARHVAGEWGCLPETDNPEHINSETCGFCGGMVTEQVSYRAGIIQREGHGECADCGRTGLRVRESRSWMR